VDSAIDRDADIRARIQQHSEASEGGDVDAEHAIYAADAILDYPQSGERFRGRSRIQAQRGGHPAERHFTIRRILGTGELWVSECVITYDGVPTYSLSVMEITDGLVTHETQYSSDPATNFVVDPHRHRRTRRHYRPPVLHHRHVALAGPYGDPFALEGR
jgi:hypothetical protein